MLNDFCFDNVELQVGERCLAKALSLDFIAGGAPHSGSIVALAGASGIGKTSLTRLLVDEHFKRSALKGGCIRISQPTRIAYLPQRAVLVEGADVRANLSLFARIASRKTWIDEGLIEQYCSRFGLMDILSRKDTRSLSGGEVQRVMLVRTLSLQPDVLILDEPFVGIDTESKSAIVHALAKIARERGTLIILISHSYSDVRALCDKIFYMETDQDGLLRTTQTPMDLMEFSRRPPTLKAGYFVGYPFACTISVNEANCAIFNGLSAGPHFFLGGRAKLSASGIGVQVSVVEIRGGTATLSTHDGQELPVPAELIGGQTSGAKLILDPDHGFSKTNGSGELHW